MPENLNVDTVADIKANCTVDIAGCWIWNHSTRGPGYAQITGRAIGRGQMNGHVLVWILTNGRNPAPGLVIMHTCHVKKCCNPEHVVEGTHSKNHKDSWARGDREHQREKNRRRMQLDTDGVLAKGREIGMRKGLLAMNGLDIAV